MIARRTIAALAVAGLSLAVTATGVLQANTQGAGNVTHQRLLNADSDPDNWMAHGRTWSEDRFSPLTQINADTIDRLSLAYTVEFDTNRGQEATPIVVDGVMYVSTAWSKVMALDAATGEQLWFYDPQVDGAKGAHTCCDVVNRGVAVWEGKVFVGTIDGRLVALDAATGTGNLGRRHRRPVPALYHHQCPARGEGQCHYRQFWRRTGRARLSWCL